MIEHSRKEQILKSNFEQLREKKAFIHVLKLLLTSNKDVEQKYVVNIQIIHAALTEENDGSNDLSSKCCETVSLLIF